MAITGTTVNITDEERQEFIECVRLIMRDYASNNIMLDDVQFTDKEVDRAITLATSRFNSTPVLSALTWRDIPEDILFHGTAYWLMLSESFLQVRNQVSVPADDLGVIGIDDKMQLYNSLAQQMKADFDQRVRDWKDAMNLASGYGSFSSGYSNVSRFHHN